MKIGIIGAAGKAGKRIAEEARIRGNEVTAIVRSNRAQRMINRGYALLEKDLFDLVPKDLEGFDAVVSAYGVPLGRKHEDAYQKAAAHLINIFASLPDVRLLVVGGSGSLYLDETKNKRVLDTKTEALRKDDVDMAKALELYQKSGIQYTYFSPAMTFDARGKRTGEYIIGSDNVAVKNDAGESYISYDDYAIAMLDEIENAQFIRKRMTAASNSRPDIDNKPFYGLGETAPKFEGLSQYREPFCFELEEQSFCLVMDDGKKYFVEFITGDTLRWGEYGKTGTTEYYECAKGGDGVYFVNFELAAVAPRTNLTLILDVSERLLTLVKTIAAYDPQYPYLCDSEFVFGAIHIPGFDLPEKRHAYTSDLLGKRIHWHYSPQLEIIHVYYATDYMRIAFPEKKIWNTLREDFADWIEREPYDEKAAFIKVRDGLYIVSCVEQNKSKRGETGNSMLFLIDTVRVHDVGRSFGYTGLQEGKVHPENYVFGAYGNFIYSDGVLESKPNVYLAEQEQADK